MEKVHCICVMRNLVKAMSKLESNLSDTYGLSLNEAMVLCCISDEKLTSSTISHNTGLLPPHTSKTISSIEKKALVKRYLGSQDKRQMYFKLTPKGHELLCRLKENGIEIPESLQPFFNTPTTE